jgi:hypothetical protein
MESLTLLAKIVRYVIAMDLIMENPLAQINFKRLDYPF